jgi:hypothetical protein
MSLDASGLRRTRDRVTCRAPRVNERLFGVVQVQLPIASAKRSDIVAANIGRIVSIAICVINATMVCRIVFQNAIDLIAKAGFEMAF